MISFEPVAAHPRRGPRPNRNVVVPDAQVSVLRAATSIVPGGLAQRTPASDRARTLATDLDACGWWIPADAVWPGATPDRPQPIGLAAGTDPVGATLHGLSDRLGYEAACAADLPTLSITRFAGDLRSGVTVFDGRLDHDVPTVVVVTDATLRWGAGLTWDAALQRAMCGNGPIGELELAGIDARLREVGLFVATVDLATPRLRAAGVVRRSTQLLVAA